MAEKNDYVNKSSGQMITTYIVIGLLVYGAIYFLFMRKPNYTMTNLNASISPTVVTTPKSTVSYKTGAASMTLYTFDKDSTGVSNCYDQCAVNWPPYLVKAGEPAVVGLTTITRKDGAKQYASSGMPLYYYIKDVKVGDTLGDGVGGTWHLAK